MRYYVKIKKIIRVLLLAALFGITYSLFFTVYENIRVNNVISNFVERANDTPSEVVELNLVSRGTYIRKYFEVPRETLNEKDGKNVFMDDEKTNIGQFGDFFVTPQSPFPTVFGFHQFMSYYYGGHAAIKSGEDELLEATGFPDFGNESLLEIIFSKGYKGHGYSPVATSTDNYWMEPSTIHHYYNNFYRTRYMGLRAVNPFIETDNSEELYNDYLEAAVNGAKQKIEDEALYNFLFFLNMRRKYYCTDFVSRTFEEAFEKVVNNKLDYVSKGYAKKLNDDGFITSVNDLILSRDTYLTFYVEINEEEYLGETKIVENIYYLEDVEVI